MVRFLLIASLFCAVTAAGLGFFNRAKLARLSQDLVQAHATGDEAQKENNDARQRLKQTEDRLATQERLTQQERDTRSEELNSTKAKLNQMTQQLTARDGENKALTAALTEAGRNLEQKQRAENDRQALAKRLMVVEEQLNRMRMASTKGKAKASPVIEGSILSINRDAGALTISLGSAVGVTTNSRLTVMKEGEKQIQLRVISVEPESCVAQFVTASPENFAKLAVGDPVTLGTK
jgi:septal ring factor EnvC (AmiA/AmiB activator)